jgi:predicted ArsR family transcriptional regulator
MTDFAREHARNDNIDTSHVSAERAESMAERHKGAIYAVLKADGPQTSDEIARKVGLLPHQVIKRVSDLRNENAVVDSGERRQTRTGRPAAVWKVAPLLTDLLEAAL